jgi:hypothetical protein
MPAAHSVIVRIINIKLVRAGLHLLVIRSEADIPLARLAIVALLVMHKLVQGYAA